jgi:hypothetical protein
MALTFGIDTISGEPQEAKAPGDGRPRSQSWSDLHEVAPPN